jgi:signal transduction histidine kinase
MSQRVIERTRELAARNLELERMIAALHEKQSQLIHAEKLSSVGRLAAGIAHEINTPVQYIGDNMSFLGDCFGHCARIGEAYRELLATARRHLTPDALRKADAAIADADLDFLLEEVPAALAQTREGLQRINYVMSSVQGFANASSSSEPFDLNRCIEDTIMLARGEWRQVASLDTDFDASLPLLVGDRASLSQVILNLIVNAVDAIVSGQSASGARSGSIRVVTRRCAEGVEIRVSDNGCGIRDEIRGRIFEPFFTTKEVGRGTGQGLAVVWDVIVEKHLGSVEVESEPGQGTIFVLRLPAAL